MRLAPRRKNPTRRGWLLALVAACCLILAAADWLIVGVSTGPVPMMPRVLTVKTGAVTGGPATGFAGGRRLVAP